MNTPSLLEIQTWLYYQRIAIDCAGCLFMSDNAFKAKDLGLRAQKKILSRMATKTIAKTFIDGTTASLLDNVYRLAKLHTGEKQKAERLVKNVIKIVIKIGVLQRNNQFNQEEDKLIEKFRIKFQNTQMAIISFYEVDFSYDLVYLQNALSDTKKILKDIVQRHLTDKSLMRIEEIFNFFNDSTLLDSCFKTDAPYKELIGKIVKDLNQAMETGDI